MGWTGFDQRDRTAVRHRNLAALLGGIAWRHYLAPLLGAIPWRPFPMARRSVVPGDGHKARKISTSAGAWRTIRSNCVAVAGRETAQDNMMLNFPNDSRSFDRTRRAVRFWGYDTSMEASFFVTEAALKGLQPNMPLDEDGMLGAFDSHRDRIYAAAAKVYARGRKGSYDLERSDF